MLCYYSDTTFTNLETNILILKKWEKNSASNDKREISK